MRLRTGFFLLLALSSARAGAQVRWTTRAESGSCDHAGRDRDEWCETREATLPAPARLTVEGGDNGGVRIAGADRRDVHVLAHVWTTARTAARAKELASEIQLRVEGGRLSAEGPRDGRRESWGVDWEIDVPRALDVDASTLNGGIAIADVSGAIDFRATNGGIALQRVGGDVRGQTVNGGLDIELAGSRWDGRGLDAQTTNGGVTLTVPDGYGAELEAGTVNGGFDVDFPITVRGRLGRTLRTTLGGGGPPIRAVTTNGGVRIRRR